MTEKSTNTNRRMGLYIFFVVLFGEYVRSAVGSNNFQLPGIPKFLEEPKDHYYIVKNKPVLITCKASPTTVILKFKCSGVMVNEKHVVRTVMGDADDRAVMASHEVTRDEVEEYFGEGGYWCECHASSLLSDPLQLGKVKSSRGYVETSYIKKAFEREPIATKAEITATAVLQCLPPLGVPPPEVFWLKGNAEIDVKKDVNFIISNEGNLIINQAQLQNMGNYTCGARNAASRRISNPVMFTVFVDGGWSTWSQWTECSSKCGKGIQRRARSCSNPNPQNGGATCQGEPQQKTGCTTICPVDGLWSSWSSWSTCSPDCIHHRRRSCDNPPPTNGGGYCGGNDLDTSNCTAGMCRDSYAHVATSPEASKVKQAEDIAMYVGLFVAFAVFVTVIIIIVFLVRRRSIQQRDASSSQSGDAAKKITKTTDVMSTQPDLTQTVVTVQGQNGLSSPNNNHVNSLEKLPIYSEPITPPHLTGSLNKGSKTLLVEPTILHNLNSPAETKPLLKENKSSIKLPIRPNQPLKDRASHYSLSGQLPSNIEAEAVTWSTFDYKGGRLSLPESGVNLMIPEGAIKKGQVEDIYIAVCRDNKDRPQLSDKHTILSPVVLCGPQGIVLKKPVILSLEHCANMRQGAWVLSVYNSDSSPDEAPNWQRMVTLGQETINTPVYTQLDPGHCHIMTEQLQSYALIGESVPGGRAVKILNLAAFAPATPTSMDFNIRVYVVEGTHDALEGVLQVEKKLGGKLLYEPKQISFQDGGNNMCLTIEELSSGWRSKLAANYQEIPFQHIWSGNQNNLHCSFSLELIDRAIQRVGCMIQVYQKGILSNRQVLHIVNDLKDKNPLPMCKSINGQYNGQRGSTVTSTSSSGVSSMVNTDPRSQSFRLPKHIRDQLCLLLDPPNARGNDWRMLAQALTVDRYINFFATKPSPTMQILDLWEARHREDSAVTDIMNILRVMGRMDAAAVLEKDMGSWL